MKKPVPSTSLSPADAAFLYLERKEIPLHIASVSIFESPIPFKEFVASIRSRLHLVPRYLQIAVVPPWNLGSPTWEYDPNFDIYKHIFHVTLDAPGGEAELEALAGRILSHPLDRKRPLWDMHVIDGLKDGRGAIIWRLHHALADGVSGTELLKVMLDSTPEGPAKIGRARYRIPPRQASKSKKDPLFETVRSSLEGLLALENGLLSFGQTLLDEQKRNELKGLLDLLPELAASVERLPFNKPCTGERKFSWTEFSLADVQAVREAVGGTVNDIVLAVLTRALARYVKLHGQSVVNRFVRIVCPVNLRPADHHEGLGNQISFLPVALPMDAGGPTRTLQAVTARTETLKHCGALGFVGLAAKWLAAAPLPLQALFWQSIPEIILPVPALNMICTNVMGSPTPLYALGRKMLAAYPQVPTGYDLGVGCAAHSYNGKLFFGLIADTHAAPDVDRLRDFVAQSFAELREAAALEKSRGAKRTRRSTAKDKQQTEAEAVAAVAPDALGTEAKPLKAARPAMAHSKEAA